MDDPQLECDASEWERIDARPRNARFSAKLYRLQEDFLRQRLAQQSPDPTNTFPMESSSAECTKDDSDEMEMARVQHSAQSGSVPDIRMRMDARSLGSSPSMSSDSGCGMSDSGIEAVSSETEPDKPEFHKKKKAINETEDEKKRRRVSMFLDKLSPDCYHQCYASKTTDTMLKSIPFLDGTDMVHFTAECIMHKVRNDLEHTTLWADLCTKLVNMEDKQRPASATAVTFKRVLLDGHVKAQFGDGSRPQIPETANEDPRAVLRAEECAREMYLSNMHFLALLFCHGILPERAILHCIQTLLPQSFWKQRFDEDKLEAVCILVKICVPFMNTEVKQKTRSLVHLTFTNVLNSVSCSPLLKVYVRNANNAWHETKNPAILRVAADHTDDMEPPPPRPPSSPSPVMDEMADLGSRVYRCRIQSTSCDASEKKKKRKPRKKKPRTVSSSSVDSAVVVIPESVSEMRKYEMPESDIPVEEFSCGFSASGWSRHRSVMRGYARIIGKSYGCG